MTKQNRSFVSLFLAVLLVVSAFIGYMPQQQAKANDDLINPVVEQDKTVLFQYDGHLDAESVKVAGSFTDWQNSAIELQKEGELWTGQAGPLPAGAYEYKLVIDGNEWIEDPNNPLPLKNDNSQFVVTGLSLKEVPNAVEKEQTYPLQALKVQEDGAVEKASDVQWSLSEQVAGVSIEQNELVIADHAEAGEKLELVASKGDEQARKTIEIIEGMYEYTIHYHRTDNQVEDWQLWIFNSGVDDAAYSFSEQITIADSFQFAKGTFSFPEDQITILPRLGDWEQQEGFNRDIDMPVNANEVAVWVIEGIEEVFYSEEEAIAALNSEQMPRHIRFHYDRPDRDYEGWNLWVWGTNAQDDQIDFTEIKDGQAYVDIAVSSSADRVGFVLRQGEDWDTAKKDVDPDRYIQLNSQDLVTKVFVQSGEVPFHTVPEVKGPEIESGNATFYYRDQELYYLDAMGEIEQVELSFMGERFPMKYERENERYVYHFEGLETGKHEYSFFVTIAGEEFEVADFYNEVDGQSYIEFDNPKLSITGQFEPSQVTYNQNAVLSVELELEDEVEISELYADTSNIGGSSRLSIDPELMTVTVGVDYDTTAGEKEIPIYAIDQYGNVHRGETTLTIETRQFVGDADFDWDEARVYFLLIDRFFDGDPTNNDPYGVGYDTEERGAYQGGDLKGITKKLDYLEDLGINTIWINPIVENIVYDVRHADTDPEPGIPYYGYHGYWASNFEEINPHFGTMEDFHELIDEAHERGMKIMLDVVLNHGGYGLKGSDAGNEHIPHFPTEEDRERFEGMFRDGGTDTIKGELAGLPDFLTEDPEVRQQVIDWQVDWIEKSTTPNGNSIDYFRVDTVLHVEDTTWMDFKNELTREMPEFKMIGEAWGAGQHDDFGYLQSGMMDSLLDFEFKSLARNFANGSLEHVQGLLEERNKQLSNHATLGQFLGSHDEDGFLYSVNGDVGKLLVASALQITAKGQPVVYYGEELGLTGASNYPYYDNRYDMAWNDVEGNEVHEHYQTLLNIRADYSELFSRGDRSHVAGSDEEGYLIFERSYGEDKVLVALNTNEEAIEVELNIPEMEGTLTDLYSQTEYEVENETINFEIPSMQDGATAIFVLTAEEQEPPGTPGGEVPGGNGGDDKGERPEDETNGKDEEKEKEKDNGSKNEQEDTLPNTATNAYNWLLIGGFIFIAGAAIYIYRKRKKVAV
ncbi:alpha-amylase family glycosyl hydrolase [Alkalihalobacillus pseudalcaliphilus]|uniref:alpha-amylase family glycosyl hydrolase n=1 Tax=Alkalihalobacillus pseudalcaliphilus TaxID=79884 RepID=UPI00064D9102|nr:alpha-amylase family glycosyl hydrolase [Alkalihalobacillus pseudalcaliphilus]KMK75585.1 pullulanase [Alkalihalobacillus pseudalcaliphilus]